MASPWTRRSSCSSRSISNSELRQFLARGAVLAHAVHRLDANESRKNEEIPAFFCGEGGIGTKKEGWLEMPIESAIEFYRLKQNGR
jgi:hypothetical protein